MCNKIFSIKKENNHKIVTIMGVKIKFRQGNASEKVELSQNSINKIVRAISKENVKILTRITPKPYLTNFSVDIAKHCNLNCKCCAHFSPVAEPGFYDLEQYKRDITRLSELTCGLVDKIGIMGGEPLLNPNVLEYLTFTKEKFPNTNVRLVTNGILLTQQDEHFWKTIKEHKILIEYTKYDIKLDYNEIDRIINKYGVSIETYSQTGSILKTTCKLPLDLEGQQCVDSNFMNCFLANNCIFLNDGRLYTCTMAPNIENFNKYFNKNIPLTKYDGVDIYEVNNIAEVMSFLAKPIPFCKYCNVNKRVRGLKWGISKKDISEWTLEE